MKYQCEKCGAEYELDELQQGQPYQCRCGELFALPPAKKPSKILPVILMVIASLLMAAGLLLAVLMVVVMERPHITPADVGVLLAGVVVFALGAILAALCDISLQLRRH